MAHQSNPRTKPCAELAAKADISLECAYKRLAQATA